MIKNPKASKYKDTVRATFALEKRVKKALADKAKKENITQNEIVNEALKKYLLLGE